MERMKVKDSDGINEIYLKVTIQDLKEENKKLKSDLAYERTMLDNVRAEYKSLQNVNKKLKKYYDRDKEELMESCYGLAKENDKLKSDLMEDMKEITKLENQIKKLKEENEEYKKMFETQLKDGYIKNTAEFLDKKFPKVNGFMEEDTLQELRDIGEL